MQFPKRIPVVDRGLHSPKAGCLHLEDLRFTVGLGRYWRSVSPK